MEVISHGNGTYSITERYTADPQIKAVKKRKSYSRRVLIQMVAGKPHVLRGSLLIGLREVELALVRSSNG